MTSQQLEDCLRAIEAALKEPVNPPGWQNVDGVELPPITWAEPITGQDAIDASNDHARDLRKHGG